MKTIRSKSGRSSRLSLVRHEASTPTASPVHISKGSPLATSVSLGVAERGAATGTADASRQEQGRQPVESLAGHEASIPLACPAHAGNGSPLAANDRLVTAERGAAVGTQLLVYSCRRASPRPKPTTSAHDGQPTLMASSFINRMSKTVQGGCARPP
jgi:hypothetical protein